MIAPPAFNVSALGRAVESAPVLYLASIAPLLTSVAAGTVMTQLRPPPPHHSPSTPRQIV